MIRVFGMDVKDIAACRQQGKSTGQKKWKETNKETKKSIGITKKSAGKLSEFGSIVCQRVRKRLSIKSKIEKTDKKIDINNIPNPDQR